MLLGFYQLLCRLILASSLAPGVSYSPSSDMFSLSGHPPFLVISHVIPPLGWDEIVIGKIY